MISKIEIAKEIGKDILRIGKNVARRVIPVTYPVLGNLSWNAQRILEEKLGPDYDAEESFKTSLVTNIFTNSAVYGGLGYYLSSREDTIGLSLGFLSGFLATAIETGIRIHSNQSERTRETRDYQGPNTCASLVGKIISFPLDAVIFTRQNIYGPIIQYCNRIKYRAQENSRRR